MAVQNGKYLGSITYVFQVVNRTKKELTKIKYNIQKDSWETKKMPSNTDLNEFGLLYLGEITKRELRERLKQIKITQYVITDMLFKWIDYKLICETLQLDAKLDIRELWRGQLGLSLTAAQHKYNYEKLMGAYSDRINEDLLKKHIKYIK